MMRVSLKALAIGSAALMWAVGAVPGTIMPSDPCIGPRTNTDTKACQECFSVGSLPGKPGQSAVVQYSASARSALGEPGRQDYCVAASIRITGTETWTTSFPVKLSRKGGPVGNPVGVPNNIPANTTRELPAAPPWCVNSDQPPTLVMDSPYGQCVVKFLPSRKPPTQ